VTGTSGRRAGRRRPGIPPRRPADAIVIGARASTTAPLRTSPADVRTTNPPPPAASSDATATPSRTGASIARARTARERRRRRRGHEAVLRGIVVGESRQPRRPVRRDQAEAVPAVAPGLRDAAALEDDVLDTACRELVAHRETGLSSTDDRGRYVLHRHLRDGARASEPTPAERDRRMRPRLRLALSRALTVHARSVPLHPSRSSVPGPPSR
jgi:hypothetical protein